MCVVLCGASVRVCDGTHVCVCACVRASVRICDRPTWEVQVTPPLIFVHRISLTNVQIIKTRAFLMRLIQCELLESEKLVDLY